MVQERPFHQYSHMIRRLTALLLWTYFAWYLGATVAAVLNGPTVVGPIAAVMTAALAAVGWARTRRPNPSAAPHLKAQPTR
jgi:membrane protein required for beta-lactamase induction